MSAPSATKRKKTKNSVTGKTQQHPQVNFRDLVIQATRIAVTDDLQKAVTMSERRINANLKHTLEAMLLKSAVLEQILMEKLGETELTLQERLLNEEDRIEGYTSSTVLGADDGNFVRLEVIGTSEEDLKEGVQRIKIKHLLNTPPELSFDFESAIKGMKTGEQRRVKIIIQDKEQEYDVTMRRVSIKNAAPEELKSEEVKPETSSQGAETSPNEVQ